MENKKKILFLRPYYGINVNSDMQGDIGISDYQPHIYPDYSILMAATIAKKSQKFEVYIIDANIDKIFPDKIISNIDSDTDIIIFKSSGPTLRLDINFIKKLRNTFPLKQIFIAGHIASLLEKWIKENLYEIDKIITEPLEDYIYKLVYGGLSVSINDFPTPDYTLINYKKLITMDNTLRVCLSTSRGCSVNCSYCPYPDFYGNKIDYRSINNVLNDIKSIQTLGVREIVFRDQYFTYNKKRIINFCKQIISQKIFIDWICETRIDNIDFELLDLMIEAGMKMICFGVESSNNNELKSFNRPKLKEKAIIKRVKYLENKNILTLGFYMIGFPNDTWDTILETFHLAKRINSTIAKFSVYSPLIIKNNAKKNLTPIGFYDFYNAMKLNACRNIETEELLYLTDLLTNIYHIEKFKEDEKTNYIRKIFFYHVIHQNNYHKNIFYMNNKEII